MRRDLSIQPVLNALFVFETAARELSFTRAADILGMAQPSVSRFIANLESHIGVALFERQHNRITLTDAGVALFKATELGLSHIRAVLDDLTQHTETKRFSIASSHGFAHMWVLPRIEGLRALLPGWEIRLNTSDSPQGYETDEADLVIRFGSGNWPSLTTIPLFTEEVMPVCAPKLLEKHGHQPDDMRPEALTDLPLLVQDHGEYGWLSWADWLAAHDVKHPHLPGPHPVPGYHFILQHATEGKGVALAWRHLIEPYLSNGWLIELPDMRVHTKNGYYATHTIDHPQSAIIGQWLGDCAGT
ncbi:LysR substrate-binding domain-containing protein [Roseovarius aestuarii]|uniref:Glycine cleavage system transcriptional activator n=1 Tax=Roseovarius aestuarii TaxID=475083 RepID=A0A1X7BYQ2_9RHOB|nr:LysR substrate-binding domain-containing protein [Roseovarius aestuarii]SMC14409.1 Glycine cleavage system transcriptional activator [Roseovarius aestuarii]